MQLHREGRLAEAERAYRELLSRDAEDANATFLLGVIAMDAGRLEAAVELFGQATTLAPKNPAFHSNLGEANRRLRRFGSAMDAMLKAMSLAPDLVAPTYNLGLLLDEHGAVEGALTCFERAAELKPDLAGIQATIAAARSKVTRARKKGATGDAASALMLSGLAESLGLQGRRDEALALAERALEVDPRSPAAHNTRATLLLELQRLDEAIAGFERSLEIDRAQAFTYHNLGNALSRAGRLGPAIDAYRRAVEILPGDPLLRGSLLYALQFDPGADAAGILAEARAWDRHVAAPLRPGSLVHAGDRTPDRRLRLGYVSPDFRNHCQRLFLTPLLRHHDHETFEVFCYSNVLAPDDTTQELLGLADQRRLISEMSDAAVAERIREDRIDVLVDLTMHMERNRLLVFARKPAPVQVTWLAYPGTTGLSAMDYRVTDRFLDPPGAGDDAYVERSLTLPDTFWCYDPCAAGPEAGPLPALSTGHVRLGCLNNFIKVNDGVVALWARVMRELEGSELVLLGPSGETTTRTLDAFEKQGIARSRVEVVGRRGRGAYLALYQGIDLCLDTFPYNGHTTSLDAFWMGVPVVTRVGATVVGRAGLCQAMNLGLPELVASTADEYVKIAVGLGTDLERLAALRVSLRDRMERSPLMDAPRFVRNLEGAYRQAWRDWCGAK
jgi:protein O-GlcNAc transferase